MSVEPGWVSFQLCRVLEGGSSTLGNLIPANLGKGSSWVALLGGRLKMQLIRLGKARGTPGDAGTRRRVSSDAVSFWRLVRKSWGIALCLRVRTRGPLQALGSPGARTCCPLPSHRGDREAPPEPGSAPGNLHSRAPAPPLLSPSAALSSSSREVAPRPSARHLSVPTLDAELTEDAEESLTRISGKGTFDKETNTQSGSLGGGAQLCVLFPGLPSSASPMGQGKAVGDGRGSYEPRQLLAAELKGGSGPGVRRGSPFQKQIPIS